MLPACLPACMPESASLPCLSEMSLYQVLLHPACLLACMLVGPCVGHTSNGTGKRLLLLSGAEFISRLSWTIYNCLYVRSLYCCLLLIGLYNSWYHLTLMLRRKTWHSSMSSTESFCMQTNNFIFQSCSGIADK